MQINYYFELSPGGPLRWPERTMKTPDLNKSPPVMPTADVGLKPDLRGGER